MEELFYSAVDVACIIDIHMLPINEAMNLTRRIWREDNAYIHPNYRADYKKWALAVMYWSDYMQDKVTMDAEFPAVQEMCGGELSDEAMLRDNFDMDLFFKNLRIRRSREVVRFLKERLYFYHIQTALLGNNICDVETMDSLDDMITFRVL